MSLVRTLCGAQDHLEAIKRWLCTKMVCLLAIEFRVQSATYFRLPNSGVPCFRTIALTVLPCFKKQFGQRALYRADAPPAPVTRMGFAMFSSYGLWIDAEDSSLDKTVGRHSATVR